MTTRLKLLKAASDGDIEAVKEILAAGADADASDVEKAFESEEDDD